MAVPRVPGHPPLVAGPNTEAVEPVLTADNVTDYGDVDYVADPFMFVEEYESRGDTGL